MPSSPSDMSNPTGKIRGSSSAALALARRSGVAATAVGDIFVTSYFPLPLSEVVADAGSAFGQAPPSLPAGCS